MDWNDLKNFLGVLGIVVTAIHTAIRKSTKALRAFIANELEFTNKKLERISDRLDAVAATIAELKHEQRRLADHQTVTKVAVGEMSEEIREAMKVSGTALLKLVAATGELKKDFGKVKWDK